MSKLKRGARSAPHAAAVCGLLILGLSHAAVAKTLCVNPTAASGCYATIGDAVGPRPGPTTVSISALASMPRMWW